MLRSLISRMSKTIGTHNGTFHADEVLACVMLKTLPEWRDAEIVRTRNQDQLDKCDIVVDVGGTYDHSARRYDHHQKSFTLTLGDIHPAKTYSPSIRLSSAGLIYAHYGHQVLAQVLKLDDAGSKHVDILFDKIYSNFIQEIDAIDNGIEMYPGADPLYRITTNLSSRVGNCNPRWDEKFTDEIQMERFHKAMELVRLEFIDKVDYYGNHWWPARDIVHKAISSRESVHSSGEIISFAGLGFAPWKEHLFDLEKELGIEDRIKFVLYQDEGSDKWRVLGVPISPGSFVLRLPLAAQWRGLRDEELSKLSGIPGCTFVHGTGFTGGAETYDGVLQMAVCTMALEKNNPKSNNSGDKDTANGHTDKKIRAD